LGLQKRAALIGTSLDMPVGCNNQRSPPASQKTMARSVQINAEAKKGVGRGKKERNIVLSWVFLILYDVCCVMLAASDKKAPRVRRWLV